MTARPGPSVLLFSGPETLSGIDRQLRREGVRLVRIASGDAQPIDPSVWGSRLTRPPGVNTVVLTSRAAVVSGVRPWRKRIGRFPAGFEFWAVGPGTERALRAAGVRRVRRPPSVSTESLAEALGGGPPRSVAYLRSDLAGPRLARRLRASGHRVVDVVVYRTTGPRSLTPRQRRELRATRLLVVTSPSGLGHLRAVLGPKDFRRIAHSVPLVVLGERSRRAARRLRFRSVSVAPDTTPQRFTRFLLREFHHVPA